MAQLFFFFFSAFLFFLNLIVNYGKGEIFVPLF